MDTDGRSRRAVGTALAAVDRGCHRGVRREARACGARRALLSRGQRAAVLGRREAQRRADREPRLLSLAPREGCPPRGVVALEQGARPVAVVAIAVAALALDLRKGVVVDGISSEE